MMSRAPQDKMRDFAGTLALCSLIACLAAAAATELPAAEPADSGALHAWEGGDDPASLEVPAQLDSAPTISSAAR